MPQNDTSTHNKDSFATVLEDAAQLLGVEANPGSIIDHPEWTQKPEVCDLLKEPLTLLCASYLHERREKDNPPIDPVARFHLGNGSRIEQLNWLGDTSAKGMRESCDLMVTYVYALSGIKKNIEAYSQEKQIAAAPRMRKFLSKHDTKTGALSALWRQGKRKGC